MSELFQNVKKKVESADPITLFVGGLGLYALLVGGRYYFGTVKDLEEKFPGMNFYSGNDSNGLGSHLFPIVFNSQEDVFQNFAKVLNEYPTMLERNFENEDVNIFTFSDSWPNSPAGYVYPSDIDNGRFNLQVSTEEGLLQARDDESLIHILVHELAHLQHSPQNILDIDDADISLGSNVTMDNVFGLKASYDDASGQLGSVALNEIGTEYIASYVKDEILGDGEFTFEDFWNRSSYFDEVVLFQDFVNGYFGDYVDKETLAIAFADAMDEQDGVQKFAENLINGFEIGGYEHAGFKRDVDEFVIELHKFNYENLDLRDY